MQASTPILPQNGIELSELGQDRAGFGLDEGAGSNVRPSDSSWDSATTCARESASSAPESALSLRATIARAISTSMAVCKRALRRARLELSARRWRRHPNPAQHDVPLRNSLASGKQDFAHYAVVRASHNVSWRAAVTNSEPDAAQSGAGPSLEHGGVILRSPS